MQDIAFGYVKTLHGKSVAEAEELVAAALKTEGFGVLTRIDVKATLKQKIDADFKPYLILGACNPVLAHKALSSDESVGLMLPCNVVVSETPEGAQVAIADPQAMFKVVDREDLRFIADEAEERLRRVYEAL